MDKNGTTTFLPLNMKISGPVKYVKDKERNCLTEDLARHIFKKVELEDVVNVDTMKQKIKEDKFSKDNIDDDKINPYQKIIVNNIDKDNIITSQMEQWSILSDVVNYVQYDRNLKKIMMWMLRQ